MPTTTTTGRTPSLHIPRSFQLLWAERRFNSRSQERPRSTDLTHAPGDAGPSTAGYPGDFIVSPLIVVFAFTDANGNIIAQATGIGAPPVVGNVGASATLTVPYGAAQLQIGINSQGGNFSANSGSFVVEAVVSTSAITQVSSIVGLINAAIWGDSPHSGPVASYIWKNPNDGGTGMSRTTGTAQATSSNNSLIFDSTPEDGH